MLDDLKYIHQRDAQDALGKAEKQWQQLQHDFGVTWQPSGEISNVVLAGMGGSAWPGLFVQTWPGLNVPFEIVRNYTLPTYANEKTLFISSSYSGNTEETLSALSDAEAKKAQIVVVTAGGKLMEIAKQKGYPLFAIPPGLQPRMSSMYFWVAFVQLFEGIGLVAKGSQEELAGTSQWLSEQISSWKPEVATDNNPAKKLALELMGKSTVVYSGPLLFPAANKWKICFNENSKNLAWCNFYPEFSHNEFIGWSGQPVDKPFAVVEIQSSLEHDRVQKRFEVSQRLLSGKRPAPEVVMPKGENVLQQLLWTMTFGDYVSIYLALLNNVDPTPVDLVEKFKVELG